MKKDLSKSVEIPEGIEVSVAGNSVSVKGPEGELKKKFNLGNLKMEVKDSRLTLGNKKSTKVEKRMMNTIAAHVRNLIKGVQEKYVYELRIAHSHFPMTVEVKGKEGVVKNFLGEKNPRKLSIPEGAEVEIKGQDITIKAASKEVAGQAAANFEKATRIKKRDRRIFQDGIYITKKAGKEI